MVMLLAQYAQHDGVAITGAFAPGGGCSMVSRSNKIDGHVLRHLLSATSLAGFVFLQLGDVRIDNFPRYCREHRTMITSGSQPDSLSISFMSSRNLSPLSSHDLRSSQLLSNAHMHFFGISIHR